VPQAAIRIKRLLFLFDAAGSETVPSISEMKLQLACHGCGSESYQHCSPQADDRGNVEGTILTGWARGRRT